MRLSLCPVSLDEANHFVMLHHRHHEPVAGHKFSVGAMQGGVLVGVVIVGRPVSRHLQDGWTLEVNRLATDGTKNACSLLYGAAWRVAKSLGYRRIITYTLPSEGGASLRAAGWRCAGEAGGRSWARTERPRTDKHPTEIKHRWEAGEKESAPLPVLKQAPAPKQLGMFEEEA